MSCYHPMKAFIVGVNPETKKKILKIKPYDVEYLFKIKDRDKYYESRISLCPNRSSCSEKVCDYDCLSRYFDGDITTISTLPKTADEIQEVFYKYEVIPCGKCAGCRVDRSKEWANRLILEEQYSDESWFLTLTYDEEHVPRTYYYDREDEEMENPHEALTLHYRDFQKFMKRLRKHYGDGIRFYCAGEYGERTHRPHYHAIMFNLHIDDLQVYGKSDSFTIYESKTLDEIWSEGKVIIAPVTWATCAYVARYVTKKYLGDDKEKYRFFNMEPECSKMSRKPGIGKRYFEEHSDDIYETYIIMFGDECNSYKFKVPKYFDYLMEKDNSDLVKKHKDNAKKRAKNSLQMQLTNTDLKYLEYLEVQEDNFKFWSKYQGLRDRSKV